MGWDDSNSMVAVPGPTPGGKRMHRGAIAEVMSRGVVPVSIGMKS